MGRNVHGLDESELDLIRGRDKVCVYSGKVMHSWGPKTPRGDWATIEHLNHLPPWDNHRTVAISCRSCNSSRSDKTHAEWFQTAYCLERGIGSETVNQTVLDYLRQLRSSYGSQ